MAQENTNATEGYQMKTGWGTIAMLISATGMGLVPLFSRWATRTDMFDGTLGLNAGDSIGALMACGRMGMGVLFFVILMVATHKVKTFKELKLTPAIALGGLMIGMSLACYVTSTLLTTVANAVLFIYTGPVICVLAARIFRKEPMSGLQWICLVVVFIGMLFGEGLLGFGVGGQFFGLDFSLETSTPEFPQKGIGDADRRVIQSIPQALATTSRVCSSVNVASLRAGINMDAVLMAAQTIIDAAKLTADQDSVGASKFVCFANMVEDSPFMAGAVHGGGEADAVINVGVSGPGVMAAALETLPDSASMMEVAEKIKQTAFKITRAGELMSREAAHRLGVEKGIVDLSLAPTPAIGDSVARILEIIGVGTCGGPGTTCALAMLNDAVKKGGVMASSSVGGLSGAFIPVSEDAGMIAAVEAGALSLEKLEAMTCVCSVGLDMIAIPGDTPVETIAGIIADEMAIGVINNKTTAVRVIPAIGKGVGDCVEYGGLFGRAPIMPVNPNAGTVLAHRGGRFPAPLNSLKN